jgi:A/G-specific adenine glycosylase
MYWYSKSKRDLPWRQTKNPYYIWLSEIILQQTQIKQGLPYYNAFVTRFPNVFKLAKAKEEDVLKLWQGLGYYSRARNLHFTAKYIVNECNGVFPNSYKGLLQLKGVGDYTASAIASICYNEVTAVVDGNVYRVLSRYFGIETPINSSKGIKEFKQLAQELIDINNPATFNQAIMEFGAVQCKPKNPNCNACPLQDGCMALSQHKIKTLPVKINSVKVTKKHFNFLVFVSNDGRTILEKREGKGVWENLYQFPLIETLNATTTETIKIELAGFELLYKKDFNISLYNSRDIVHKLSHQHLYTKFWIITVNDLLEEGILTSDLENYPVPVLIGNFLETFKF